MKRDFPKLHKDVVFGRSNGRDNRRIIWQPRIGCWYTDKKFAGEEFPAPFTGMEFHDLYRELDCSARLYEFNSCFQRAEHPGVTWSDEQLNATDTKTIIQTPVGEQIRVLRTTDSSWHTFTVKWEVETEEELKVAAWREENATWEWDQEQFDHLQATIGDLGAPTMFMPRMNVQSLYIEKMGSQNGIYAIYDWVDTSEAFFRALDDNADRLIDVINASPIDIINFGENIHSGTLPPRWFRRYHLPECRRRAERLHSAGKFVCSHWDGDVRPLLPFATETGLDGIEAITPAPQGDVTLEEVREALGDDMFLLDGLPAIYFDETFSVETLIDCTERIIELFAPKLVLGISDEISSTGDLERIRVVGEIVDAYNASVG